MDKRQAEVTADKLLEPARQAQLATLRETDARLSRDAKNLRQLVFSLLGLMIVGPIAYLIAGSTAVPYIIGGSTALLLGIAIALVIRKIRNA